MLERHNASPIEILVAVDGSEHSTAATHLIGDLPLPPGSEVTVLGVVTPRRSPTRELMTALDEPIMYLQGKGIQVKTGLLHGHPTEALVDFANEHRPHLMILAAKGQPATLNMLLGGKAQRIVEQAMWPIMIVRAPYRGLQRILLTTDGSLNSQEAAEYLANFPLPENTHIHILHVLMQSQAIVLPRSGSLMAGTENWEALNPPPELQVKKGQGILDETRKSLRSFRINVKTILTVGPIAEKILQTVESQQIDLLVAGSRGLGTVKSWLLGSVSRQLMYECKCSILIIPEQLEVRNLRPDSRNDKEYDDEQAGSDINPRNPAR